MASSPNLAVHSHVVLAGKYPSTPTPPLPLHSTTTTSAGPGYYPTKTFALTSPVFCWIAKLGALAAGQPTPAPDRFCSVTTMAVARTLFVAALWSPASLLNSTAVPCTLPAATFRSSAARKAAREGGHVHGMLTTALVAARKPSQEPACRAPGFVLAFTPKSGTSAGLTPRRLVPAPDEEEGDAAAAGDDGDEERAVFGVCEVGVPSTFFVGRANTAADDARSMIVVLKNFIMATLWLDVA